MRYLKIKLNPILMYPGLVLLFIFFMAGCKSNSSDPVSVNNGSGVHNATISVNTNPVVTSVFSVVSAKFLIKRVELEVQGQAEENELTEGPFVVHLTPGVISTDVVFGKLPPGTYHELNFLIHKPSPEEVLPDPDFRTGTPDDQRFSFIIVGAINGVAFVYRSKVTIDEEMEFEHPIIVTQTVPINIVIQVDPNMWFFASNGAFLDPTNPVNSHAIDMNIKASFRRAFLDNNNSNTEP